MIKFFIVILLFLIIIFIFGVVRGGRIDGVNQVMKVIRYMFILAALIVALVTITIIAEAF
jgi:hypothetical protein